MTKDKRNPIVLESLWDQGLGELKTLKKPKPYLKTKASQSFIIPDYNQHGSGNIAIKYGAKVSVPML